MRHHVFTAAMGIVLSAALVPLSVTAAAAADPTGYWLKAEQGERPGKMQVYRCGAGKRYLCAKIVWLQSPLDSNAVRSATCATRTRACVAAKLWVCLSSAAWLLSVPTAGRVISTTPRMAIPIRRR